MKIRVRYTTYVVASHYIRDHTGPCSKPHGHNYLVTVEVERTTKELDNLNMVIDYYVLKKVVDETLADIDHRSINELLNTPNATSELLAIWIARRIQDKLGDRYRVTRVEVCETPDFCVEVTQE